MGKPKCIATCGDRRMFISLFKRMTVVRGADRKRVRTMGTSSSFRAMSGLGSGTVSQLRVEEGRHGTTH